MVSLPTGAVVALHEPDPFSRTIPHRGKAPPDVVMLTEPVGVAPDAVTVTE